MIWVLVAILAAAPTPKRPMEEVADLMAAAGRLLENGVSDERVTDKQAKAVAILDRLIASAEERERKAAKEQQMEQRTARMQMRLQGQPGKPQGNPTAPAARSVLPPKGKGDRTVLRRRVSPGEAWGGMPPAERDRILQAIKKTFPSRYRDLVEQYFKQLDRKSKH